MGVIVVIVIILACLSYGVISSDNSNAVEDKDNHTDSKFRLVAEDVNMTVNDSSNYSVQITDSDYNPLNKEGETIIIAFKNVTYECKTNESGAANLPIHLIEGNYTFTAKYGGEEIISNVVVNNP